MDLLKEENKFLIQALIGFYGLEKLSDFSANFPGGGGKVCYRFSDRRAAGKVPIIDYFTSIFILF